MSDQIGDIAAALAYQIKKEIAEAFFGGRKALEEEQEDLFRDLSRLRRIWEIEVFSPLKKVYNLLPTKEAGSSFLVLLENQELKSRLEAQPWEPAVGMESLSCTFPFALTCKRRYRAAIFKIYEEAEDRSRKLFDRYGSWEKKVALHNQDLIQFKARYNLGEILVFVKSIEPADDLRGVLGENTDIRAFPDLERKLALKPLTPPSDLSAFRPLPAPEQIRRPLRRLIDEVYRQNRRQIKRVVK